MLERFSLLHGREISHWSITTGLCDGVTRKPAYNTESIEDAFRHTGESRYPVSESNRRLDPGLRRGDEFKHQRAGSIASFNAEGAETQRTQS